MRIDFHCHTLATKSGDSQERNIAPNLFRKAVLEAGVKIVCITNHNLLDKDNYRELWEYVKDDGVLVLPGVELDVMGLAPSNHHFHSTIIFDNKDIDAISEIIKKKVGSKKPDEVCVALDEYIDICNRFRCISAVHYLKSPSPDESTIVYVRERLNEKVLFFYELSNYRALDILVSNAYKSLIGSDVTDWKKYKQSTFTETKIEVNDFNNLYRLFSRDKQIIETFLSGIENFPIDISKHNEKDIINIYRGTNIFFGNKASGKTEALSRIKDFFEKRGNDISFYDQDENKAEIKRLLEVEDSEKNLEAYGGIDCRDSFEKLFQYKNEFLVVVKDFERYIKTKDKSKNKSRLKIISISIPRTNNYNDAIRNINNSYSALKDIFSKLDKIDNKYVKNKVRLKELLEEIRFEIFSDHIEVVKDELAMRLTEQIKKSMRDLIEKNTSTKHKPETVGFTNLAHNFFESCLAVDEIRQNLNFSYTGDKEYVMRLDTNKDIYKRLKVRRLSIDSKSKDGFTDIQKLKTIRKRIDEMVDSIGTSKLDEAIVEFNKCELNRKTFSLQELTAYGREFVVNDSVYIPSSGEETMVALEKKCRQSHQVYIFDEPEKSLGNSYVSRVLIPKFQSLDKQNKIIVIATHNANIAVNTAPLESVLKIYDGYSYHTYSGNSYSNELINTKDANDIKDWKEETIDILEGGRKAFEERSEIYGKE